MGLGAALGYSSAPVAPPEEQLPPSAAAPTSQGPSFGQVLGYAEPAPAPPPAEQPVGYRPPDAYETGPAPAQPQAAPQAAPQTVPQPGLGGTPPDPRPIQDRLIESTIPQAVADVGRSVEEFKAQPTWQDKAGQLLGLPDVLGAKGRGRVEQRLEDEAKYGDPDATLGGMGLDGGIAGVIADPSTLLELPDALGEIKDNPEVIFDSMAMDVAGSPGGLDKGKQSFEDWAEANPEKFAEARAQGEGAATEAWKADTQRTLDSGGIGGAVSGISYDVGTDPTTPISIGSNAVGSAVARGTALAGKGGLARGVVVADNAVQTIIDPLGMAAETGLRKGIGKALGGATNLSGEAKQAKATDITRESVGAATQAGRPVLKAEMVPGSPTTQTAAPAGSVPPSNGLVPPNTTLVGQGTPQIASQPTNGSAPPSPAPQPAPASATAPTFVPAAPLPPKRVLDLNGNGNLGTIGGARPATSSPARPLTPLMRDGTLRGARWVDPRTGQPASLTGTWDSLVAVKPEDVKGFSPGRDVIPTPETAFTQHLAAATEQGRLYNDRPRTRSDGNAAQRKAGNDWTHLMGDRIKEHGAPEVERLSREYQAQQGMDYYRTVASKHPGGEGAYWQHRAEAIVEAAKKAEAKGADVPAFTLKRGGKPYTFTPKNGSTTAPIQSAQSVTPTYEAIYANPIQSTMDHFSTATKPVRENVGWNMQRLMDSSEGFGEPFKAFRQRLYRSGAWSKDMAKNPDGYARYQAVRDLHANMHGITQDSQGLYRRGTVGAYGALTPEERAVAEGLAGEFRAHLDSMNLGHVHLAMVDAVSGINPTIKQADLAAYDPENDAIELAIKRTYEAIVGEGGIPDAANVKRALYQSLNHEGFHALRAKGVIQPAEWDILVREARARKYGPWADEAYKPRPGTDDKSLTPDQLNEEAVAEMFGDFANDMKALSPATRTIFQKVVDFFAGFIRTLSGNQTGADVMNKMLSGKVGARSGVAGNAGTRMASRYTGPAYHGSQNPNLDTISATPPTREWDTAATNLGAFFTTTKNEARAWGQRGYNTPTVYEAQLDLKNAYDASALDDGFLAMWGDEFENVNEDIGGVLDFRDDLIAKGHDGIVVWWEDVPRHIQNGAPVQPSDARKIKEVISFTDVPVKPTTLAQRGKASGFLQRATGIGPRSTAIRSREINEFNLTEEDPILGLLPEPQKAVLRSEMDYGGTPTPLHVVHRDITNEVEELRFLAETDAKMDIGGANKQRLAALKKTYAPYEARYDWADPKFADAEADRIITDHTTQLWSEARFPAKAAKDANLLGSVGSLIADTTALRRAAGLTNLVVWPRQFLVQMFGNVMMNSIAKPDAVFTMFKPKSYLSVHKGMGKKAVLTDLEEFQRLRGKPVNAMVNTGSKSLAKNKTAITNPALRRIREIFAPDWAGNIAATPDGVHRGGVFERDYFRDMRKEIKAVPAHAGEVFTTYRKKGLYVDAKTVEQEAARLIKGQKHRGEPISRITPQQLKDGLIAKFGKEPGIDGDPVATKALRDAADRVARDFTEVDNLHLQRAAREVQRVGFSWDETNADKLLSNIILYHYWSSRAGFLYAKEMAKKPWLAAAFMNLTEQLMTEAEEYNYPDWMKGFTRILNSPAGLTMLFHPLDAISTMFTHAEWQYGANFEGAMRGDLSQIGAMRGVFPAVVAPWLDIAATALGVYGGEDARTPTNVTGLDQLVRRGAQLLNGAGYAGLLPAGMGRDEQGNFRPYGEMPLTELTAKALAVLGRPPMDVYAGTAADTQWHLRAVLLEDHPEWGPDNPLGQDELEATVNAMWTAAEAGDVAPEILEAERRRVGQSLTGPDFPGLPAQLESLVRVLSPIGITAQPELKTQALYGFDATGKATSPVGLADSYDASDLKGGPYDTLEAALASQAVNDFYALGMDSGINEAKRVYDAIAHHNLDAPITIYGKPYSNDALKDGVMTEAQRYDLADQYLASQGYTKADLDEYKAARDAAILTHPDVAGYFAYKDYIESYPGEIQGFVDTAVRTSPSFARYMEQTGKQPGTPEYYEAATYQDAYFAIEGRRSGIYDPTTLPPAGTIPGQPAGMTFAMMRALEANADAAASSGGGDGTSYDDFVGDVQGSVDDLYNAQQMLDAWFPGAGYVAGVTYFEKGTYNALKDAGYNAPAKGDIAYEYNDWLLGNATTTDPSVKAFLDQRETTSSGGSPATKQENVTPEMILAQRNASVDVVDTSVPRDEGRIDTSQMQRATPNLTIPGSQVIYSQPSLDQPTPLKLLPGALVHVIEQHGEWAYVVAPGNQVGWMPTVHLSRT
jgi:hypothetical protein